MKQQGFLSAVVAATAAVMLVAPVTAVADDHGRGDTRTVDFSTTATSGTESPGSGSTNPTGYGCQFGGVCVVDTTGNADVTAGDYHFSATYTSTLSIDYGHVTLSNNDTYYCAPATGTVQITSNRNAGDRIDKTESGQVCGGTATGAPHTFSGTFQITGGSGRFTGATGSGSVSSQDDGHGTVTSSTEQGTISYHGAHGPGPNGGDDNHQE
ncbi:MAG: hypothetical protein ACYDAC_01005 [Candidatus Dormibacteria bacterium]